MQIDVALPTVLNTCRKNDVLRFSSWNGHEDLSLISYGGSVLNVGSTSGQHQEVNMEATMGAAEVDKEANKHMVRLWLLRSNISVDI